MMTLSAKIREKKGKKVKNLIKQGILPAVLYGPQIKNLPLELNMKEFYKIYKETGESSLISLQVENKSFPVLIHDVTRDPVSDNPIHVDFYQPILTKEVEATVPLVFEGESKAVRDLGGTLIKEIQEIEVWALPQDLPHEIKIDISKLKTFEDEILIKDLRIPQNVKIKKDINDIVALVTPLEKIEEELKKPIEEKVEEVKGVEKKEEKEKIEEKEEEKPKEKPKEKSK